MNYQWHNPMSNYFATDRGIEVILAFPGCGLLIFKRLERL
jgi:hypothetical protein